jgi:UDP-4-amino-4,6-dideoxy-N-acetyl-beta-L-altrosamine transaminase
MIPYGRQDIRQEDVDAVITVLQSDFLTQGPAVPRFEKAVAEHVGALHSIAVNSATSALHIACLALGLHQGDWLWTSPITFVASANCGLYCGAKVDFVDIDPLTFNLCPRALETKLIEAQKRNRLPKILIAVHMCGQPCDMEAIHLLSKQYGFHIIEDASHAIGGKYKDEFVGSCRYSDVTIFSFHPVKIITTAEGGMALTNCPRLAREMYLLRSHGITRDEASMTRSTDGPWFYQQLCLGFNYRLTEIQAALGLSQMQRLDTYVAQRHRLADKYDDQLKGLPVVTPRRKSDRYSALHLYVIRLNTGMTNKTRRQVYESLVDQGIGVNIHYIPVHTHPYYLQLGFAQGDFPEAERYYQEAISLPMFQTLSESDQNEVIIALKKALE